MKNRQKITRVELNSDAGEDYFLLGVVSAEPDYKLSLALNRKLKISLKHIDPIELNNNKGLLCQFSRFHDSSGKSGITYNLVSNRSGNELLLKKLNRIDFLLQIYSPDNDYKKDNITSSIKTIESIIAVFTLEPGDIRDKNLQYLIP